MVSQLKPGPTTHTGEQESPAETANPAGLSQQAPVPRDSPSSPRPAQRPGVPPGGACGLVAAALGGHAQNPPKRRGARAALPFPPASRPSRLLERSGEEAVRCCGRKMGPISRGAASGGPMLGLALGSGLGDRARRVGEVTGGTWCQPPALLRPQWKQPSGRFPILGSHSGSPRRRWGRPSALEPPP